MIRATLYLITCCFGAGMIWVWDRHPPYEWTLPLPVFHPTFHLPDSLETQRDKAVAALAPERAARTACTVTLASTSAALTKTAAEDAQKLAKATRDVEGARAVVESLRITIPQLKAYVPKGVDACAQWDDADRVVKEDLK